MSLNLVLRPEAQAEFDEAFDYYEQVRPGLGEDFVMKVQNVFDRIAQFPKIHAVVFEDIRKGVVQRFPYCIYYREEPNQIVILAVFHSKRDPADWQARVFSDN